MFSLSARIFTLVAVLAVLLSCSRDKGEPAWKPESHPDKNYQGGLYPVWIKLKDPAKSAESISWKTGYSRIAYRKQEKNKDKLISADTAYLYWEQPPPPTVILDSTKVTSGSGADAQTTWKVDSTYLYMDTVFAIIDGYIKSEPILIEIKNILPKIKSISVGGSEQPGDSTLTIAAHPGDRLEIVLRLEKAFNKTNFPNVEMPGILGKNIKEIQRSDSLYEYEWLVPNEIKDNKTSYIRIKDTGGYGERLYNVHFISYTDYGSVWVASEKELVKYSPSGAMVVRVRDTFDLVSDIAVDSRYGKLFVIDQYKNTLAVYSTYGKLLYKDSTLLKKPTSISFNIEGDRLWVADQGFLKSFDFSGGAIDPSPCADYALSGSVKGLSSDQFKDGFLWFAIPESDIVGFVHYSDAGCEPIKYMPTEWNRPSMVSYDPEGGASGSGVAWVADSTRIVAIDTNGTKLAVISGFDFVNVVSASKGSVWASDILKGIVYRFDKNIFKGTSADLSLTIKEGTSMDKFSQPSFVSAFIADSSAWIMDKGKGEAVRVDKQGNRIATGIGLIPFIGKTIQKAD